MKFYVTGRATNYPRVEDAFRRIKERGHEASFEWTTLPMAKPYSENQERAADYAARGIQGAVDADIYIIFADKDGNGVFAELGAALAANVLQGSPRIYAIGEENKNAAMFHYHPSIMWRLDLDSVLHEVC
jgi:Zn-dependent protease with chaperone function